MSWEMEYAHRVAGSVQIATYLTEGWMPFAVDRELVYLRRWRDDDVPAAADHPAARYEGHGDYQVVKDAPWPMCGDCGVLVASLSTHDRFHDILNDHARAIAVLVNSHAGPLPHAKYDVRDRIGDPRQRPER